ncbi:Uncharacterised protein [Paenibacillus thiaminolyticus]|nr:Uncharacterised protein [Paenibacillus thiaminolyticus]
MDQVLRHLVFFYWRQIELLLETEAKIHRLQDAAFFVWYIMEVTTYCIV